MSADGGHVHCPTCGEPLWIAVDPSGGSRQRFTVDCEVCCRPIVVVAAFGADGSLGVTAHTEDQLP